jgi:SAM-dependent methyltransferase
MTNGWIYDKINRNKDYESEISSILPYVKGDVIDIGGTGGHSLVLKNYGFNQHLIDISPSMVKCAKNKGLDAEVFDMESFRHEKMYDTAIMLSHTFNLAKKHIELLENIKNSLRPGGFFAFDTTTKKGNGCEVIMDFLYTRVVKKSWEYHNCDVSVYYPFLLHREKHNLFCPCVALIHAFLEQVGFSVIKTIQRDTDCLVVSHK